MTYGTTNTSSDAHALLPSYSPSVSRSQSRSSQNRSYSENSAVAPGWPTTFEEGADTLMKSPVAMGLIEPVAFGERSRVLDDMGEFGKPGKGGHVHVGTSSFKEAVFNAINVLLGVGVLASPFALRSSGWAPLKWVAT